jgi:hypothetical protein
VSEIVPAPDAREKDSDVLTARVTELYRRFPARQVIGEAHKIAADWFREDSPLIETALANKSYDKLLQLRPQVLMVLSNMLYTGSDASAEKPLLDDTDAVALRRARISGMVTENREALAQYIPRGTGSVPLTDAFLEELTVRLVASQEQYLDQVRTSMELYGETLRALQDRLIAGQDINQQLAQLGSSDVTARGIFDDISRSVLDEEYDGIPAEFVTRVRQLVPLWGAWAELRFAREGRVNHPAHFLRVATYMDSRRDIPGVEFSVRSPLREIFHCRDDVKDAIWLTTAIVEFCAESLDIGEQMADRMSNGSVDAIVNNVSELRAALREVEMRLTTIMAKRSAPADINREMPETG